MVHTAIIAIFNSNIRGEEHQLKNLNTGKNAKKGEFADKATRNNYNNKWNKKRKYDEEDTNSKYGMNDSLYFLSTSLDPLVQSLIKDGTQKFPNTKRHYPNSDMAFKKRTYAYEFMDGAE